VISRLLRPHENPQGHWVIALGISLSGLIQIPLPGFFYERLRGISPWGSRVGWGFMVLGLAAMILTGITRTLSSEAHGVLAMIAFVALVLSVMANTGLVVKQGLSRAVPKDSTLFWSWISLTVLALIPMMGTSLSQLYLYCFARGLGQAPLVWRSRGVPFVFSLAFWEWLTCVFLIVYLMLLVGLSCRLKNKNLNLCLKR
jgi:magnesium-transporting ATPase (P-type)